MFTGRKVIYTDVTEITEENICNVVQTAMNDHMINRGQIDYLYNYYKGKQPILDKIKEVRPEINNKVIENRANEIVNFKVGYLLGEPIQYVARGESQISDKINKLNDYVFTEDKASKDKELAEWFYICGTSYRLVLPDSDNGEKDVDDSPFEIYTLDPRNTFVVYSNDIEKKPVLGVTYVTKKDYSTVFTCYTNNATYYITSTPRGFKKEPTYSISGEVIPHILGSMPIIEYPANSSRLGVFETVLTLLDSINQVASDRIDAVDTFVQALMVFKGVDVDDEEFKSIRELGGIRVPSDGDVSYLVQELNQQSTQTLVDSMYQTVLTIVGMPSTSDGGTSDSSNNGAVILKNGWYGAEARAKDNELTFKKSEKKFLTIALRIAKLGLKLSEVDVRFTRRNYENLLVKSQVLTTMLANNKIHPRLAFEQSGMFIDTELAYRMSEEYMKENEQREIDELERFRNTQNVKGTTEENNEPNESEDNE